jgi:integrase
VRAILGARFIASNAAQPRPKPFEVRDTRLPGFILRVQPSGARSYYAQHGRGRRTLIGAVGHFTADEARGRCEKILGNVAHGRPPLHGLDGADSLTLGNFIGDDASALTGTYHAWLKANKPKNAARTLQRLATCFKGWYSLRLTDLDAERIESWQTGRLALGRSPQTVLRDLMALSGVLSRAVRLRKLTENPVKRLQKPKIDRTPKPRYLDAAEEKRLRVALLARDAEMIEARVSANKWRAARHLELLPALPHYGHHLTAAVLLSLNTGLRRGELLSLTWSAIDLKGRQITVEGSTSKSSQTRHVPANAEVVLVLERWREQCPDAERVFPIDTGFKTAWAALLDRAQITRFRWHDLRHHFGSRLAQAGVPLNTIRELLGHGSIAMTLRYSHLSPDQRAQAVAKLTEARAA